MEYNGDAISESEWFVAEDDSYERDNIHDEKCFICGAEKDEHGFCENGCDY
jgi:hypothetical protein